MVVLCVKILVVVVLVVVVLDCGLNGAIVDEKIELKQKLQTLLKIFYTSYFKLLYPEHEVHIQKRFFLYSRAHPSDGRLKQMKLA